MSKDKRVLTVQDISCVGQCSLTVALPIISACGFETAVLPSAVLSTHTGGSFSEYTFRDLTFDMPLIAKHWLKEGITFDAIYTGYLGSANQVDYVLDIMKNLLSGNAVKIVDPAMADNGRLYSGFDAGFVKKMTQLCSVADIILPNITEACLMTDTEYMSEGYNEEYILGIMKKLTELGAGTVIMTGIGYDKDKLGVGVYKKGSNSINYYFHERIERGTHGTGDIYASTFTGAYLRGFDEIAAAKIAADYTLLCIKNTLDDEEHWYGAKFEKVLPYLMKRLGTDYIQ